MPLRRGLPSSPEQKMATRMFLGKLGRQLLLQVQSKTLPEALQGDGNQGNGGDNVVVPLLWLVGDGGGEGNVGSNGPDDGHGGGKLCLDHDLGEVLR